MLKDILTDLLIDSPYYGYLAAKVTFEEDKTVERMTMTYRTHPVLRYNKTWFSDLTPAKQKGVVIHELLHLALLHGFRRDGRKEELWHMACDIAVGELMPTDQRMEDLVTTDVVYRETGLVLPVKATAEIYYQRLLEADPEMEFPDQKGTYQVTFSRGKVCYMGPLEDMPKDSLMMRALLDELAGVQIASLNEHVLEGPLSEQTEEAYRDFKINWRDVMKRFLAGQGRIVTRKTYKRASRRFDDMPGTKRSVGVRALVAIDESGSVSNKQVANFYEELLRINGINHAEITAVSFDTSCSEPMPLNRFVLESKRTKRGGTDFRPVFALADALRIPLVILFTDGEGDAPASVDQKVLWVLTEGGRQPAAYGMAIRFMEDGR